MKDFIPPLDSRDLEEIYTRIRRRMTNYVDADRLAAHVNALEARIAELEAQPRTVTVPVLGTLSRTGIHLHQPDGDA